MPTRPDLTALTCDAVTPAMVEAVTALYGELVLAGAALGWIEPPGVGEVGELLETVGAASERGDAAGVIAYAADADAAAPASLGAPDSAQAVRPVIAFGYWQRYGRATHYPHADLPHLAVAEGSQRQGLGGQILDELIARARREGIEQLTLDSRGDNDRAMALWRSREFVEYGRLTDFVAVGEHRYDKTFWVLDLANRPSP